MDDTTFSIMALSIATFGTMPFSPSTPSITKTNARLNFTTL